MQDNYRIELAKTRLEQSAECLRDAEFMFNVGSYRSSANRSYYCIFHAMRAALAMTGFDSKRHSGIITAFRQQFIKPGVFQSEFSDIIQSAFDNRGKSDYTDFYIVSKEHTAEQIEEAGVFLSAVEDYVKTLF